jgi:hypothetical protein
MNFKNVWRFDWNKIYNVLFVKQTRLGHYVMYVIHILDSKSAINANIMFL